MTIMPYSNSRFLPAPTPTPPQNSKLQLVSQPQTSKLTMLASNNLSDSP